jgi:hypothetical protein
MCGRFDGEIATMTKYITLGLISLLLGLGQKVNASIFDGAGDNQTADHGYYYTITGGKFPTGTTPNGDNASGGTFRFVTDDPAWGYPTDAWQKDDWFSDNASIGLTLHNGGAIVYDNNGLEPGAASAADPDYYDYYGGSYPAGGHGAHVAYSMSNNFDWIYAGYFKLTAETIVTSLTGYFAFSGTSDPLTLGFDPDDPAVRFGMNIWSNVAGDLLPTNTGSFDGDVFDSDTAAGTFAWSDTGFNRVGSSSTQDIYRMTYSLSSPITLLPGEYWFSHDARLVPEPISILVWSLLATIGIIGSLRTLRATV